MSDVEKCDWINCEDEPTHEVLGDPTDVELVCEEHANAAFIEGYEVRSR